MRGLIPSRLGISGGGRRGANLPRFERLVSRMGGRVVAPVLKLGADRFPGFFHCLLDTGCIWILLSPICGAWKDDLTSVAVWVARESGPAVHNGTLLVIEHSSLLARRNSLFLERVAGELEPSTRDENTVFRVGSLIQAASLRILFGNAREPSKPRRLLGKERPIFWRMALVGPRLLIDLCKSPVLVGRQQHRKPSLACLLGPSITEQRELLIKRAEGQSPTFSPPRARTLAPKQFPPGGAGRPRPC